MLIKYVSIYSYINSADINQHSISLDRYFLLYKDFNFFLRKLSYPCINRKYTWKRNFMSKEAKRLKKEARMKKLLETKEKKLRGGNPHF